MSSPPDRFEAAVEADTNVLLIASDPTADRPCVEMLTSRPGYGDRVVSVALDRTLDDLNRVWKCHAGEAFPSQVTFLTTDASRHSTTAGTEGTGREIDPVVVSDLYDLALSLGRILVESEGEGPAVVCFHSITSLLAEESAETATRFLRTLTRRLRTSETVAHAHFHLDPEAHDAATVERIRPLFDAVVERSAEKWSVTVRRADEEPPGRIDGTNRDGPSSIVAGTGVEGFDAGSLSRSLDTVMDLLSSSRRRAVLYYPLDRQGGDSAVPETTIHLDRLVDYVIGRERDDGTGVDRETVLVSLVHVHLPKLDAAAVLDYDRDARRIRYHGAPALWACVEQVAALETEMWEW